MRLIRHRRPRPDRQHHDGDEDENAVDAPVQINQRASERQYVNRTKAHNDKQVLPTTKTPDAVFEWIAEAPPPPPPPTEREIRLTRRTLPVDTPHPTLPPLTVVPPEPPATPGVPILPFPHANLARAVPTTGPTPRSRAFSEQRTRAFSERRASSTPGRRDFATPDTYGRFTDRLRRDFEKSPNPDAHLQWAKLLDSEVSVAMHLAGTDVNEDLLGIHTPDTESNTQSDEPYTLVDGSAMRNVAIAYATQARTTVQEGRDLETCFIDPDHPAVKRVLDQLPVEHRAKGIPAMLTEVKTLVDMGFAEFRDKPPGRKVIPCRMVEKVKFYGNGDFDKVKMRCVVRGFLQKNGVDFGATYSPSCMLATLRILLTVAVTLGWDILQLDVKTPTFTALWTEKCGYKCPVASTYGTLYTKLIWQQENLLENARCCFFEGCTVLTRVVKSGSSDTPPS